MSIITDMPIPIYVLAIFLILAAALILIIAHPLDTKENCMPECERFGYEYYKFTYGDRSPDQCWCIKPDGEPINIGEVRV